MSRNAITVDYRTLTPAIAATLSALTGETWTAAGYPDGGGRITTEGAHDFSFLRRADGLTLHLGAAAWNQKDRIAISHSLSDDERQHYSSYSDSNPRITVAATKPADQIAKDITRRLLVDAVALHLVLRQRVNQHNTYIDQQEANRKALQQAMANEWDRHEYYQRQAGQVHSRTGVISGVYEASNDNVSMTLHSVPVEVACQIARLVAEYNRAHRKDS